MFVILMTDVNYYVFCSRSVSVVVNIHILMIIA